MKTVSFETAKLAKEKGFDYLEDMYYTTDGNLRATPVFDGGTFDCYAPVQENVCQWLRESKKINVAVDMSSGSMWYTLRTNLLNPDDCDISPDKYHSYEEALEAVITNALYSIND